MFWKVLEGASSKGGWLFLVVLRGGQCAFEMYYKTGGVQCGGIGSVCDKGFLNSFVCGGGFQISPLRPSTPDQVLTSYQPLRSLLKLPGVFFSITRDLC